MAIADIDDLTLRLSGGGSGNPQFLTFDKHDMIAGASASVITANKLTSAWLYSGAPSAGIAPTTAAACDNTTPGGLRQVDALSGDRWLIAAHMAQTSVGGIWLLDRLLANGGLDGTLTTAQTVGGSLTRYTGTAAVGNLAFVEIYSQIGATGVTATILYTDDQGNSGNSVTLTMGGTGFREVGSMLPIQLASGDGGFASLQSIQLGGTGTGTAGNFGITIARPVAWFGNNGTCCSPFSRDFIAEGCPKKITGACLQWAFFNSVAFPRFGGAMSLLDA